MTCVCCNPCPCEWHATLNVSIYVASDPPLNEIWWQGDYVLDLVETSQCPAPGVCGFRYEYNDGAQSNSQFHCAGELITFNRACGVHTNPGLGYGWGTLMAYKTMEDGSLLSTNVPVNLMAHDPIFGPVYDDFDDTPPAGAQPDPVWVMCQSNSFDTGTFAYYAFIRNYYDSNDACTEPPPNLFAQSFSQATLRISSP